MPRPILSNMSMATQSHSNNRLSANHKHEHVDKVKLNRLLRNSRSSEYMRVIQALDSGGHVHNQNKVNDIINTIKAEFCEVDISGILLGYVATCYLGRPYEVHTLDIAGEIIEHYKAGQHLTNGLEKARSIALHGGYEFIEVYVDCCRAISSNGSVSVIND